jgi:hypothetical protein
MLNLSADDVAHLRALVAAVYGGARRAREIGAARAATCDRVDLLLGQAEAQAHDLKAWVDALERTHRAALGVELGPVVLRHDVVGEHR